jgi:hypothetical protein
MHTNMSAEAAEVAPQTTVLAHENIPARLAGHLIMPHEALSVVQQATNEDAQDVAEPVLTPPRPRVARAKSFGKLTLVGSETQHQSEAERRLEMGQADYHFLQQIGNMAPNAVDNVKIEQTQGEGRQIISTREATFSLKNNEEVNAARAFSVWSRFPADKPIREVSIMPRRLPAFLVGARDAGTGEHTKELLFVSPARHQAERTNFGLSARREGSVVVEPEVFVATMQDADFETLVATMYHRINKPITSTGVQQQTDGARSSGLIWPTRRSDQLILATNPKLSTLPKRRPFAISDRRKLTPRDMAHRYVLSTFNLQDVHSDRGGSYVADLAKALGTEAELQAAIAERRATLPAKK